MNHPYGDTVNPAGKKEIRSSAALALVVGLVLAFAGTAVLAEVIPGIDIIVRKKPGGIPVRASTRPDGTYQFTGLAPGSYDLIVGGQRVQTIAVGGTGSINGVVSTEPDGKGKITIDGEVALPIVVRYLLGIRGPNSSLSKTPPQDGGAGQLPTAPVVTSLSNKKAGGVAEKEQTASAPLRWTPVIPRPKEASIKMPSKVAENESPRPTSRGLGVAAGDVNGDGVDATSAATQENANTRRIGFPFDPARRRGIAVPKPTGTGDVNGNGLGAQTIDGAVGLPLNPTATPSKRSKASNTATKADGGNP